jgi:hypothetical protein
MFRGIRRREEISSEALAALRQQLRDLPVAEASPDFDARVHARLRSPESGWVLALWVAVRPAVSTAAVSLLITLAILQGMATYAAGGGKARGSVTVAFGSPASAGLSPSMRGELTDLLTAGSIYR